MRPPLAARARAVPWRVVAPLLPVVLVVAVTCLLAPLSRPDPVPGSPDVLGIPGGPDVPVIQPLVISSIGWSDATVDQLSPGPNDSKSPSLAVDGDGNVHVAWVDQSGHDGSGLDFDVLYRRWNATVRAWGPIEVATPASTKFSIEVSLAVDAPGNVHVAWAETPEYTYEGIANITHAFRNATTGTWSPMELVSTGVYNARNPSIAISATGTVHVAWEDVAPVNASGADQDIMHAWRDPATGWTIEVVSVNRTEDSHAPSIGVAPGGMVHVAWHEWGWGGAADILHASRDPVTGAWSTAAVVSTGLPGSSFYPMLRVDGAGTVHVTWIDPSDVGGAGADHDVYYASMAPVPGTWSTPELVSWQSIVDSWSCSLAVDGFGNVHVTWSENNSIFHVWRDASAGTWSAAAPVHVETTSPPYVQASSIGAGPFGDLHVAWWASHGFPIRADVYYKQLIQDPVANFTAAPTVAVAGQPVQFTFTGIPGYGTASFQWDTGDGSENATTRDPVHVYAAPGEYNVTVTVIDQLGTSDTMIKEACVIVIPDVLPVASFVASATTVDAGTTVQFTFTGSPGNEPATFHWSFGDGSANSTLANPAHAFQAAGNFTVVLAVIDADGDVATATAILTVLGHSPGISGPAPWLVLAVAAAGIVVAARRRRRAPG